MQQPSKVPPGSDAAADPSPSSGSEEAPPPSGDPESAPQQPKDAPPDVILDSGAPSHATALAELLAETRPAESGGDGGGATFRTRAVEELPIVAVGCMTTEQFVVPDVGLVPLLPHGRTVISVRQLAAQGLAVTFGSKSCKVEDDRTGQVVGEGRLREEEGFYYLDYLRVPQR